MKIIKEWLNHADLTQAEVAARFEKSHAWLSLIISGERTLMPEDAKKLMAMSNGFLTWENLYGKPKVKK